MPNGIVPGDGVHVWWPMVLGPNRARHFLLTGDEIDAAEAKRLGVVAEVVPHDQVLTRAWDIARTLAISEHTVHRHIADLLGRLGVTSRAAAAAIFAKRAGAR